jgi:hypothetical protein
MTVIQFVLWTNATGSETCVKYAFVDAAWLSITLSFPAIIKSTSRCVMMALKTQRLLCLIA